MGQGRGYLIVWQDLSNITFSRRDEVKEKDEKKGLYVWCSGLRHKSGLWKQKEKIKWPLVKGKPKAQLCFKLNWLYLSQASVLPACVGMMQKVSWLWAESEGCIPVLKRSDLRDWKYLVRKVKASEETSEMTCEIY